MKTTQNVRFSIMLTALFLFTPYTKADTEITLANVTTANITNALIDPTTGNFFVGTGALGAAGSNLVRVNFPAASDTTLTATSFNTAAAADAISAMALSRSGDTTRVCFNLSAATTAANIEKIQVTDGTTTGIMAARITDGAGAANGLVKKLVANSTYAFAAVRPTANDWLQATGTSGVTSHAINATTLVPGAAASTVAFTTAAGEDIAIANAAGALGTTPLMIYDSVFQKIYVGLNLATSDINAGDGVRSLIIINASDPTALAKVAIKTNPLATWGSAANDATAAQNTIIGTLTTGGARSLSMHNLGIMHTSTGYSYLIVNGGNGAANTTGNTVWALPLVTKGFTNEGTLADITSPGFNTQANLLASLATEGHIAATVGDTTAPWAAAVVPNQMQIIGDCVYLSQRSNTADTNQAGVVYSQALFGEEGKIVRWTRWTRAVSVTLGDSATDGDVFAFGVDARSGRTWSIPGSTLTSVKLSSWEDASAIATAQNTNAGGGVYCSYILNNASENFGDTAQGRYAVFGGNEIVVFTRPCAADNDPAGAYNKPENTYQTAFVVGTNDTNIKVTTLPAGAGEVRCLGYSHWDNAAKNTSGIFFAGTDAGLYGYGLATLGAGINIDAANALNAAPWDGVFSWQLLNGVTGSVRKIKSIGGKVYVLARDNSGTTTVDRLYGVSARQTLTLVNTNFETLAVTNTGNLVDIDSIVDFDIIRANPTSTTATANGDGGIQEQVVLLTNNGIYQSFAVAGLNAAANNTQAEALWGKVSSLVANRAFSSSNTSSPSSLSMVEIANAADAPNTYMRRNLRQALVNGAYLGINPEVQNSSSNTSFLTLDRITDLFTDGGRRLFVYTADNGASTLGSLPYDVSTYNMSTIYETSNEITNKTLHSLGLLPSGNILALGGADEVIVM